MAGHSKWSNIKHKKAVVDQKRGKIFTKVIRELVVAAKGGGEPADNPKLRAVIDKALAVNMKRDTIDKAIARGSGNTDTENYEQAWYEGYAPYSVAIIVECLTDNRNRTVGEVRHLFSKHGGNLGVSGSVSYMFETLGQIIFSQNCNQDALLEVALESGASDVETYNDSIAVETAVADFLTVKTALEKKGFTPEYASINKIATNTVTLDKEQQQKVLNLIDKLEDLDDVQEVYSNLAVFSQ